MSCYLCWPLVSLLFAACTPAPRRRRPPPPTEAPAEAPTAMLPVLPTPTDAPADAPTVEATDAPVIEPAGLSAPMTLRLPDLEGREVIAVTENAYTPLNFVDPAHRRGRGLGV